MNFKALGIGILASFSLPLNAQYLGDQLVGATGLQAGSQAPPGFYLTLPLYYRQSSLSVYGAQGNLLSKDATVDINAFALPGITITTPWKFFGAHYGFAITQFMSNGNLTAAAIGFRRTINYAYADLYVQPLILGWHTPHADITTGYSFFAPTGIGAAGHQMWINEFDLGTTLFFDSEKKWNVSTMGYLDFNGTKNDQQVKPGNILTLAGGAGRSFRKGQFNFGAAYAAQWKTTHDSGPGIPAALSVNNGRVFGVGPEVDVRVFLKGLDLGMLSVRYLWAIGPKTTLSGPVFSASFTVGHLIPR